MLTLAFGASEPDRKTQAPERRGFLRIVDT
jgi:hypothetical protein